MVGSAGAEVIVMPKLLHARAPADAEEERKVRKLAGVPAYPR